MTLKATVINGSLTFDDPLALPDGTIVIVNFLEARDDSSSSNDGHDDLSKEDFDNLHESLERGLAQIEAGQTRPVEEFFAELRQRG